MSFPVDITSVLTGASVDQLRHWKRTNLLVPEISSRPYLYSFRDLVALRTVSRLRSERSLQSIRKALATLTDLDLTEHPANYLLIGTGDTIVLREGDEIIDLVKRPRQGFLMSMEDVFEPFENSRGKAVQDFRRPRPHLEVRESRVGGWPTIEGTRVPYDSVADLLVGGEVSPAEVRRFYPTVGEAAAIDAADFAHEVATVKAS